MDRTIGMDLPELLERQDGVIARWQAVAAGMTESEIRRELRRRAWASVHPGVYVNHNGPVTWHQRAWAAVLTAWPAALSHDSAIRAGDGPGRRDRLDADPVHVAVDSDRKFVAPRGVVPHRLADFHDKVSWNSSPPRVRIEQAALDVAAEARTELDAIATLSNAVSSRRTTAARLLEALDGRTRLARRELLAGVLRDVADGTCSVLEHGYLDRVERPHGLPLAARQVKASSRGPIYRDVEYVELEFVVELDGRLGHDSFNDRDRDLDRDLDASLDGKHTIRLGWGQVMTRSCQTAAKVGRLLQARGWRGQPHPCPTCAGQDSGRSLSPGDSNQPLSA